MMGDTVTTTIFQGLQRFAATLTEKMSQMMVGDPEDKLRAPFENLMTVVADALGWNIVCTEETRLPDRLDQPDYAVHVNGALAGYVKLKAPGVGVSPGRYRGHNREQFKRFSSIPNILLTINLARDLPPQPAPRSRTAITFEDPMVGRTSCRSIGLLTPQRQISCPGCSNS